MSHQRGAKTLFSDIFFDEVPVISIDNRKGRNAELNTKRNECLVARYYYLGQQGTKSYPVLINEVAGQFYLSTFTVHDVIQENLDMLKNLKKTMPEKKYFEKKWPHLVW